MSYETVNGMIADLARKNAALIAERDRYKTALVAMREMVRGHDICGCNDGSKTAAYKCPIDLAEQALEIQ